jgi:hypothetical protein
MPNANTVTKAQCNQFLSYIANNPEHTIVSAGEVPMPHGIGQLCLMYIFEHGLIDGKPQYSNGNSDGIIFILNPRLTYKGMRQERGLDNPD